MIRHLSTAPRRSRSAFGCGLALLTLVIGCSREQTTPGPARDQHVHEAGADRKVRMKFESGPVGEIVITRDSERRLVVGGVCYFPEGTRLDVAIVDSSGRAFSRTQPTVQDAEFQSLPLATPDSSTAPSGYAIEVSASFAPGSQSESVLRQVKPGQTFVGEGMMMTRQGYFAYSRRIRVHL